MSFNALVLYTILSFFNDGMAIDSQISNDTYLIDTSGQVLYLYTDKLPQYPGGSFALSRFIDSTIKWPSEDIDFEGTIVVSFVIDENGRINDIKVINSKISAIDQEAIRVVSQMPEWIPGVLDNKKVQTLLYLPVTFKLKE